MAIRDISPMVWQRFRLHSNMSLGAFHFLLQFAFGWDNDHLHTFHIHGKDYGIRYEGGLGFYDNPWSISLASFQFENRDKFTYEYNFFRHWLLDIRIEAVESDLNKNTPFSRVLPLDPRRGECARAWERASPDNSQFSCGRVMCTVPSATGAGH
ncbi:hypothetical protein XNA1_5110019 [Xenorhabdus nematophila str. Anatoliense]|nr:hypothetical protein XNA1_5110019 [Xenorhabdus nematophila str. Anatoliense]